MSNDNDNILDDLEVLEGDDVQGSGPGVEGKAAGQDVRFAENHRGGHDLQAGGVGAETRKGQRRGRGGTEIEANAGGQKAEFFVADVD